MEIDRPNQVWIADFTFVPMAAGFAYLVAFMDVYSRRMLAWRVSNMPDARMCVDALEVAVTRFGAPGGFYTDQGG